MNYSDAVAEVKNPHRHYYHTEGHFDFVSLPAALALLAECERLRAIVDRLPRTADGVSVIPGQVVWSNAPHRVKTKEQHETTTGYSEWKPIELPKLCNEWEFNTSTGKHYLCWGGPDYDAVDVDECYSTREAAIAATQPEAADAK